MTNPKPLKAMTDEELTDYFREVLEEIRERSFDFRAKAQKVIDYCARNKSLVRLKIGVDEMKHFWRGFHSYWG